METIEIISDRNQKGPAVWMAKFSDQKTKDIMGTDTLPTPYFTVMPREEVVARIQKLNPEFKVY